MTVINYIGNRIDYSLILDPSIKKIESIKIETFIKSIPVKIRGKDVILHIKTGI